jgi:hypothetical protein
MRISQCALRWYYRRRARSEQTTIQESFAINAFRKATVLTMNNPGVGHQATRRRASKTGPEEDNITPIIPTPKN